MNYKFSGKDGHCPECVAFGKRYYIQDKYIGQDKYNYALMSMSVDVEKPKQFKNKKELASYLYGSDILDDIAVDLLIGQVTKVQSSSGRILEHSGSVYIWSEERKTLTRYIEPKQETGWCDTYLECLQMAKKILLNMEL